MEDLLLKGEYLRQQLQKGLNDIFDAQRGIASAKVSRSARPTKSRSGALMESLLHPDYNLTPVAGGVRGIIRYPLEIRFQDMKHLGNWRIYNRQIWGILYRETLPDIRFEFSEWLRTQVRNELSDALRQ